MFFVFFSIFCTIIFGVHLLIFSQLIRHLTLAPKLKVALKWFFWISGASIFVGFIISRFIPILFIRRYAFIWLGLVTFAFTFFLVGAIITKFFPASGKIITLAAIFVSLVGATIGFINQARPPVIKKLVIPIKGLPPAMTGFTLVQLSDMHLDNSTSKRWLRNVVNRTNALKPDLIAVTGDLIEEALWPKTGLIDILKGLKATHGVVAIGGNHEYYAGWNHFEELARHTGMKILSNTRLSIGEGLIVAGLIDDDGRRMGGGEPDISKALAGVDAEAPIILLYHRPTGFDRARKMGVDLQLSGHTHNGQYPPYNFIVALIFKYPFGLYREGDSHIYTSCGTSLWGPPMRIGSRSEIVHFTLVSPSTQP